MAIKVVELHHTGVRIDAKDQSMAALQDFYTGVLGLAHDQGRPTIPGIPGMWINVGEVGQAELDRMGVQYWSLKGLTDPESDQLFLNDPCGNMVELHQVDKCRCRLASRVRQ